MQVVDFSSDPNDMMTMLHHVKAAGGGDTPEDMVGALLAAVRLNWVAQYRVLVHIFDAPPHGVMFHDPNIPDTRPNGEYPDPKVNLDLLIRALAHLRIDYSLVRAGGQTERLQTDKFAVEAKRIFEDQLMRMREERGRMGVFRDRFLAIDQVDQLLQIVLTETQLSMARKAGAVGPSM